MQCKDFLNIYIFPSPHSPLTLLQESHYKGVLPPLTPSPYPSLWVGNLEGWEATWRGGKGWVRGGVRQHPLPSPYPKIWGNTPYPYPYPFGEGRGGEDGGKGNFPLTPKYEATPPYPSLTPPLRGRGGQATWRGGGVRGGG